MKYRWLTIVVPVILLLGGCTGKKKLSRNEGPFITNWPNRTIELTGNRVAPKGFDGSLKLVEEKKIKGSINSRILISPQYIGFSTSRRRFLIYDRETGKKAFQIKIKKNGNLFNPIIIDSLLIVVRKSIRSRIQIINLFTGKTIRERVVKEIHSGPIIVLGQLILGTGSGLKALSLSDLKTVWEHEAGRMVDKKPVSDDKVIYYVSGNRNIQAVRAEDGQTLWDYTAPADIVADPTLGENLYLSDFDGRVMALNRADGELLWEYQLDYPVRGGVAEFDNMVYFGANNGSIYCLSSSSGRLVWQYRTEGIVTAAPVVYGDAVLIGSQDRHIYSLDRLSGELLDRRRLEGAVTQAVGVLDGQIFAGCRKNRIYRFEANNETEH